MCIAITDSGRICTRKHKNGTYCYQHEKINEKHKIIAVKYELEEKKIKIVELEEENKNLIAEVESMRDDFNRYQIIKQYEGLKLKLSKYVERTSDLYSIIKFLSDDRNRPILKNIIGEKIDYANYFNKLRIKRNKVSHFI